MAGPWGIAALAWLAVSGGASRGPRVRIRRPHGRGRLLLPDAVGDHDRQPPQQGNCKVADTGPGRGLAMIGAVVYR